MNSVVFLRLLKELLQELPSTADIDPPEPHSGKCRLTIRTPADLFSPSVPLDRFQTGSPDEPPLHDISAKILQIYGAETLYPFYTAEDFPSRRAFTEGLRLRPASMKTERSVQALPHHEYLGMLFFFTAEAGAEYEPIGGSPVTWELLRHFGPSSEDAYSAALENLRRTSPPLILPLPSLMQRLSESCPGTCLKLKGGVPPAGCSQFYVLTNKSYYFGSSALLFPGVPEELYGRFGEYFLLPSSVHEFLILPKSASINHLKLRSLVRSVNRRLCSSLTVLSDELFVYDPQKGLHIC